MADTCAICMDAVADIVVCWNSHQLCEGCATECSKPHYTDDRQLINQGCPTCRDPMFQWSDATLDPTESAPEPDHIVVNGIIVRGLGIDRIRRGRLPAQTQALEDQSERIRQGLEADRVRGNPQLGNSRSVWITNNTGTREVPYGNQSRALVDEWLEVVVDEFNYRGNLPYSLSNPLPTEHLGRMVLSGEIRGWLRAGEIDRALRYVSFWPVVANRPTNLSTRSKNRIRKQLRGWGRIMTQLGFPIGAVIRRMEQLAQDWVGVNIRVTQRGGNVWGVVIQTR